MTRQLILCAAILISPAIVASQPASRSPGGRLFGRDPARVTYNELQKMLADQQYGSLIQVVDKQLEGVRKGTAGAGVESEHAKLLLLKGEAYLRLGNAGKAATAFNDAATAQAGKVRNEALAMALLLKRSKGMFYTRRVDAAFGAGAAIADKRPTTTPTTGPAVFNVVTDRKQAMAALLDDELADAKAKPGSTRKLRTLPQVFQTLSAAQALCAVEETSTGGTRETTALLLPVAEQARSLMESAMFGMDAEIARVQERANRTTQGIKGRYIYLVKVGLRNDDEASLKSIMETCGKIFQASEELRPLLSTDYDPFATIKARAEHLTSSAGEVLNADYRTPIETGRRAY